jgi:L-alanine-DL-glutamate epimerase-like enolase superfamily enzyme
MKITKVIAYLTDEPAEVFTWQVDRPGSGDGRAPDRAYSCAIRVLTDEGIEGQVVGSRKGRIDIDLVERRIAPELIGKDPLLTEFLWWRFWDIDRLEEFPLYSLGLADIALWDIKGKVAGLPVYRLAGGYRDRIPAYASTTSYDTEKEYLEVISAALEEGFTSVKLHLRYREPKVNAKLCRAVRKLVGDDFSLTLDASALWNYTESLWFGRVLEDLGFEWYEEPMREFDLESYARLCNDLDIPVLAAETSDGAHWNAGEFIRRGACDIMRTSTHYKGGITGGLKVAHLAESYGMNAEVHGMGLPNLHLGLAIPNNTYYEQIVISPQQVKSRRYGGIPFEDGFVRVPDGVVGIGWDLDIADLEKRAIARVEFPG